MSGTRAFSEKDFTGKLCEWLSSQGIVSELQTILRHRLITQIHKTGVKQTPSKWTAIPSREQAVNLMVAEHLAANNCHYTLSVLVSEVPILSDQLPTPPVTDIGDYKHTKFDHDVVHKLLDCLRIDDSVGLKVAKVYSDSESVSLLSCVIQVLLDSRCEVLPPGRHTDPVVEDGGDKSLAERLQVLDEKYTSQRQLAVNQHHNTWSKYVELPQVAVGERAASQIRSRFQEAEERVQKKNDQLEIKAKLSEIRDSIERRIDERMGDVKTQICEYEDNLKEQILKQRTELQQQKKEMEEFIKKINNMEEEKNTLLEKAPKLDVGINTETTVPKSPPTINTHLIQLPEYKPNTGQNHQESILMHEVQQIGSTLSTIACEHHTIKRHMAELASKSDVQNIDARLAQNTVLRPPVEHGSYLNVGSAVYSKDDDPHFNIKPVQYSQYYKQNSLYADSDSSTDEIVARSKERLKMLDAECDSLKSQYKNYFQKKELSEQRRSSKHVNYENSYVSMNKVMQIEPALLQESEKHVQAVRPLPKPRVPYQLGSLQDSQLQNLQNSQMLHSQHSREQAPQQSQAEEVAICNPVPQIQSLQHSQLQGPLNFEVQSLQGSEVQSLQHSQVPSLHNSQVQSLHNSQVQSLQHSQVQSLQHSQLQSLPHSQVQSLQHSHVPVQSLQHSQVPVQSLQHSQMQSLENSQTPVQSLQHSQEQSSQEAVLPENDLNQQSSENSAPHGVVSHSSTPQEISTTSISHSTTSMPQVESQDHQIKKVPDQSPAVSNQISNAKEPQVVIPESPVNHDAAWNNAASPVQSQSNSRGTITPVQKHVSEQSVKSPKAAITVSPVFKSPNNSERSVKSSSKSKSVSKSNKSSSKHGSSKSSVKEKTPQAIQVQKSIVDDNSKSDNTSHQISGGDISVADEDFW